MQCDIADDLGWLDGCGQFYKDLIQSMHSPHFMLNPPNCPKCPDFLEKIGSQWAKLW